MKNNKQVKNLSFGIGLSGGGARGGAHIGILKVLDKKINIRALSGASAGAIVAISYAAGKLRKLERYVNRLKKGKLNEFIKRSKEPTGVFDSKSVEDFVREIVGDIRLEDLNIPVYVCASDVLHGREVYFRRGDAARIAAASSAIPIVLTPVKIGRRIFMDGGVFNDLPVNVLRNKVDKTIAVNVGNNTTFSLLRKEIITPKLKQLEDKMITLRTRLQRNPAVGLQHSVRLSNSFVNSSNRISEYIFNLRLKLKNSSAYYKLARRFAELFSYLNKEERIFDSDYIIEPPIKIFNLDFVHTKDTIKIGETSAKEFLRKHKREFELYSKYRKEKHLS